MTEIALLTSSEIHYSAFQRNPRHSTAKKWRPTISVLVRTSLTTGTKNFIRFKIIYLWSFWTLTIKSIYAILPLKPASAFIQWIDIIHCMIMAYSIADIYLFHIFHFKQRFKFQKIQCTTNTMDILLLNILKIDTFDIAVTTQELFRSSIFRSCFMGLHEVFQNSSWLRLYHVVVSFLACN